MTLFTVNRLAGLVVKASASGVEDPGFESRLRWDFSGSSHTSDLKIGAWHYRVRTGTRSARCQYTVIGSDRKFDLQLLSQCGSP